MTQCTMQLVMNVLIPPPALRHAATASFMGLLTCLPATQAWIDHADALSTLGG